MKKPIKGKKEPKALGVCTQERLSMGVILLGPSRLSKGTQTRHRLSFYGVISKGGTELLLVLTHC